MGAFSRKFGSRRNTKTEGYSSLRSGAVDFLESAVGLGDEADAAIRSLTGEASSFDEGLDMSRSDLDYFERNNKTASGVLDVLGIGTAIFIPGTGAMKIAQTGTKLQRAMTMGALASAEGAAYGYASGRDEDRKTSALYGAAFGGVLGAGVGGFLTKNADDLAKIEAADAAKKVGRGTFLGGEEGFDKTIKAARENRGINSSFETSAKNRKVNSIDRDALASDDIARSPTKDTVDSIYLNARAWGTKNTSERFTRLVEDADSAQRRSHMSIDEVFDANDSVFKRLSDSEDLKEGILNLGKKPTAAVRSRFGLGDDGVMAWDNVTAKAKTPEEAEALELFRTKLEETRAIDLEDWVSDGDWAPRVGGGVSADGVGVLDAYGSPSEAIRGYARDVSDAQVMMNRFQIDPSEVKKAYSEQSRLDAVIDAVERKLANEATDDIAANGANLMRSVFVASRTGGDAIGAMMRKTASTALLANPVNAVLNLGETVTAPIYQDGIKAWAKTLPQATRSLLKQSLGTADQKFLSAHQLGIDKQFAGELMNEGRTTMGKWLNWASEGLYKYTGTSASHRATQEVLANSSINKASSLIGKGDLNKLKMHPGMKGLSPSEFDSTVAAIKKFKDVGLDKMGRDEQSWLLNFSGAAMNKWQAISPLSMPKAFLDNPNGRVGYSMLSYMNVNLNNLRSDIGLSIMDIQKYGLNSAKGQKAYKKAAKATAKYTALFGAFAGMWDDLRKTMYQDSDYTADEVLSFEGIAKGTLNQFASNLSSGLVNIRAEEFGGNKFEPIPAPVSLAFKGGNALLDAATGDFDPAMRFAQSAIPGVTQLDRASRMTTGQRLLTDDGAMDQGMLYDLINK